MMNNKSKSKQMLVSILFTFIILNTNTIASSLYKNNNLEIEKQIIIDSSLEIVGVSDGIYFSAYIKTGREIVNWSITVDGFVIFGGSSSGQLVPDVVEKITLPLTFGFGTVSIVISANDITKEYSASLSGPFFKLPQTTWKTGLIDDGTIIVNYRVYDETDENGDTIRIVQDKTTTVANIDMQECIKLLKNVSKHHEFTGDYESKIVRTISDNEWIIYYYTKNPKPLGDSDCVARMTFSENLSDGTAIFNLSAAPNEYPDAGVARMQHYNVSYSFTDVGDGLVEFTLKGKTSPPVDAPLWLIKSVFPDLPADTVKKIIDLVQ